MTTVVAVVAAVVLLALYVSWTAQRLDRLHARVDAADAALDAQLVRRAAAARALASHLAAADLEEAAERALAASPEDREASENALSRELHRALEVPLPADPATERLADELTAAATRVSYARQFHNDAVRDTLAVRRRRVPRLLRLWGSAPAPLYFEIDDTARPAPRVPRS